jgi:polyphosphate kinase
VVATPDAASPGKGAVERLLNRELSWLDYASRLLEFASDADQPLLERVKLCGIISSNLDDFFQVRVAGLLDQTATGLIVRGPDGRSAQETLVEVRQRVTALVSAQSKLWGRELKPALAEQGIVVAEIEDLSEDELVELEAIFARDIYAMLTPLAVGPGQRFPYISGLSLSLGVVVRDPETGEERFARVKVPEGLRRFQPVGRRGILLPLERVIAHFLPWLFPEMEFVERIAFRVTRDSDFEVSDEADDLLEAVQTELRRRRFRDVVRLEISSSVSGTLLERLEDRLGIAEDQVYPVRGMLDLADLEQLAALDRPDLKPDPWVPVTQQRLATPTDDDVLAEIRRSDILVHHPYDSFTTSVEEFVERGAHDPNAVALKTTIYRTSGESALAPALIEAAEAGKQSVCLVELKARFDERRNIEWSRKLEQAGVHVVYGFPDLKIHAKTTLVVRREANGLRRYAHIGTGNYHPVTARLYEDVGLFTADPEIAADIADLFNFITGFGRPHEFRQLLVAPINLRSGLISRIRGVQQAAESGRPARIRIKVNNLTDAAVIDALYEAAQAGAEIDLFTRSICALRAGVPGLSESIRVRSVLGRFLEHSRLFQFQAGDDGDYLLGSADLMPRNLDHRIEVLAPIRDARLRAQLDAAFDTLLRDNSTAWTMKPDGTWQRERPRKSERRRPTQGTIMIRRRRVRTTAARTQG